MRNNFILATILIGLAGCGHPLPKPVDPLRGLGINDDKAIGHVSAMTWAAPSSLEASSSQPAQRVDLRAYQNQKIGLVLSENTVNSIKWRKKEIDRVNTNFADATLISSSGMDSVQSIDHSGLAVSVERMLHEKFKDTVLIPDLHAAINEGINTVVVMDIQATAEKTCPSSVSDCYLDTTSQHSLIFVDTQTRNQLAILRGSASITYCDLPKVDLEFAYAKCIQDGRVKSLEALRGKLAAQFPEAMDKQAVVAHENTSNTEQIQGFEENKNTIENGAPAEMYSLGLRMEHSGNNALAGLIYQAIVRRFPDSPFVEKALDRQEAMIMH